jgi:hypothetical protein
MSCGKCFCGFERRVSILSFRPARARAAGPGLRLGRLAADLSFHQSKGRVAQRATGRVSVVQRPISRSRERLRQGLGRSTADLSFHGRARGRVSDPRQAVSVVQRPISRSTVKVPVAPAAIDPVSVVQRPISHFTSLRGPRPQPARSRLGRSTADLLFRHRSVDPATRLSHFRTSRGRLARSRSFHGRSLVPPWCCP